MEVLLWVGCAAAYEPRLRRIAQAFAEILKKAKVEFATLGEKELCTGDMARRIGDEVLFQELARKNIQTLKEHGVDSIVTVCPHCFNVFKNEYPALGGDFKVQHYTTYIHGLMAQGRLVPTTQHQETVTYHDPCYLGRQNQIYEAPRSILEALGFRVAEMKRNRESSLCCGAGGGGMFETVQRGKKINVLRAEEACQTGASTIVTACPFCLLMMEEATEALNPTREQALYPRDLAEIVNDFV